MKSNTDQDSMYRLEMTISHVLRGGVFFAGLFLVIGWIWMWMREGDVLSSFSTYEPRPLLESIQWALIMGDRATLVALSGLLVLVLLPLLRVLMTGILFFRQKDRALGIMALLVFITLLGSFLLGVEL